MTEYKKSRRSLLAGLVGISTLGSKAAAAVLTPSASEGPYYRNAP